MMTPATDSADRACMDGILLLDKPLGLSSNAALQRVRGLFGRVKAGHVGSLDPLATGMLPICLGEATKVAGDVLAGQKCYRFSVGLGRSTLTGDAEGAVRECAPVPELEAAAVQQVLMGFVGVREQVPPMYSALKVQGQPLYRLARAGQTVERAPRRIELARLTLLELAQASLTLEVLCSKGTYVRVLAEEIAAALGTLGHVSALRRVFVEPFEGQPMHTLEGLAAGDPRGAVLPPDWPLQGLPAVHLSAAEAARVLQGQQILRGEVSGPARVRLYDERTRFLGIGETDAHGAVHPRRLLHLAREATDRGS
jgi:tRNA pseudouridine55 synthase